MRGSRSPRVVHSSIRTEHTPALGMVMLTVSLYRNRRREWVKRSRGKEGDDGVKGEGGVKGWRGE